MILGSLDSSHGGESWAAGSSFLMVNRLDQYLKFKGAGESGSMNQTVSGNSFFLLEFSRKSLQLLIICCFHLIRLV